MIDDVLQMKGINKKDIFYPLMEEFLAMSKDTIGAAKEETKKKEYDRLATQAEKFAHQTMSRFYWALQLGQLRRLVLNSPKLENQNAVLRTVESRISENTAYVEENSDYKIIPISDLIKFQLKSLLITLDYI